MATKPVSMPPKIGRPPRHAARWLSRVLKAGKLDGRTGLAIIRQDKRNALANDLGGWDALSEAEVMALSTAADLDLIEAAYASAILRELEAIAKAGKAETCVRDFIGVSNAKGRALVRLQELATARRARSNGTPDLRTYLAERAQQAAQDDASATNGTNRDAAAQQDTEGASETKPENER